MSWVLNGLEKSLWRYLICDRHASHESPDFPSFAFQHKIYLLRLPAHTSYLTQPLDVGCFSPRKYYYRQGIRQMNQEGEKNITKRMFMDLYQKVCLDSFTPANIESAWRGAGLLPLDSARVV
jgi:hypothetical protein